MLPQLSYIIHNHQQSSKKQVEEGNFRAQGSINTCIFEFPHEEKLENLPFMMMEMLNLEAKGRDELEIPLGDDGRRKNSWIW